MSLRDAAQMIRKPKHDLIDVLRLLDIASPRHAKKLETIIGKLENLQWEIAFERETQ